MANDFGLNELEDGFSSSPANGVDLSFLQNIDWLSLGVLAGAIVLGIFLLVFGFKTFRNYIRRRSVVPEQARKIILKIQVPKYSGKQQDTEINLQKIQETISVTESIFNSIGGLKAQQGFKTWWIGHSDEVTFEIVVKNAIIYFYVGVPKYLQQYLEEQIHAQHPSALIEEVEDYNIFQSRGVAVGTYLTYEKEYIFPIKTYRYLEGDPLMALANSLTKFDENSGAAIQLVVRSAHKSWHKWGAKTVSNMHQGKDLKKAMNEAREKSILQSFFSIFSTPSKPTDQPVDTYRLTAKEEEAGKWIENKTGKSGLDVNIRLVVSAQNKELAELRLNDLVNSFNIYNAYDFGNAFKRELPGKLKDLLHNFIYREFEERAKMIMNIEELSSVFHFPFSFTDVPNIDWLLAKKAPAPINLPKEGVILGENEYRGRKVLVKMSQKDRRRHVYVIGMTGVGKSVLIEDMAIQDILAGRGVCFIDPHGDAIDELLARVPAERADDVILFDPADLERPVSMNLLEFETSEQRTMAVNELLAIFDKLYDLKATGGPMFEQYFRNSALLMMQDVESGNTILDLPRILADEDYRRYKLSKTKDQDVKDFWEKQAEKAGGEAALQNMVPYITSKLTPFISNDYMRPIISQQKSSFSFTEAVNNEKIILVKLAKGQIGSMNADLLGMIVVSKILMATLARATMPEDQRKDFYLYIDEFQNFLTDSIEVILSEARKYRLNLIIAHQYIGQLVKGGNTKFKDAIFGNVGTKVAFRIGVEDAEFMSREFAPVFGETDFLNCPKQTCFIKLLIDNANPPPFNMKTFWYDEFAKPDYDKAKAIRELSRLKYGRDRAIIEEEIRQRQLKVGL